MSTTNQDIRCTTREEAIISFLDNLDKTLEVGRSFGLPLGPDQKNVQFTQAIGVGVPGISRAYTLGIEDGAISLSRDRGLYSLHLAPVPEGKAEGPYCAYGFKYVDDYGARLKAAGYMSTTGRAPVRGFGSSVAPANARAALLRCLDKDPRVKALVKCSFTELFNLVKSYTQALRRPGTLPQGEKRLIKLLLEELYGPDLDTEKHTRELPDMYGTVYDLRFVPTGPSYAYFIALPRWMFDLNVRLVEAGYLPLVPSWVGEHHHQFNGGLRGGCSGNYDALIDGLSDPGLLWRVVLPLMGVSTLELASRSPNSTTIQPSEEWENCFRITAENLLKGRAPELGLSTSGLTTRSNQESYHQNLNSLMLAASREIPLILQEEGGDLRYIQADRIRTRGKWISMTLNNWPSGEPAIHPEPKPKPEPKPEVKPLPLSPEARPTPEAHNPRTGT